MVGRERRRWRVEPGHGQASRETETCPGRDGKDGRREHPHTSQATEQRPVQRPRQRPGRETDRDRREPRPRLGLHDREEPPPQPMHRDVGVDDQRLAGVGT